MLNRCEMGYVRVGGLIVVTAALALTTMGFTSNPTAPKAVVVNTLTFNQPTTTGGDMHPVELVLTFTGTPGPTDTIRLRPEKNDATGWRTTDPLKDADEKKIHYSFNKKDDTGPYVDVPLTGTSPQTIILDTANPAKSRTDTFVTGKVGDGSEVQSAKITITHDGG